MADPVYSAYQWTPVGEAHLNEVSPPYWDHHEPANTGNSSTMPYFQQDTMLMFHENYSTALQPISADHSISTSTVVQQIGSRTIGNQLEILNIDGLMSFVSPNNVVQMTITTLASNIIIAFGWIILGRWFSCTCSTDKDVVCLKVCKIISISTCVAVACVLTNEFVQNAFLRFAVEKCILAEFYLKSLDSDFWGHHAERLVNVKVF